MDLIRNWRLKSALYRLEGNRCDLCGTLYFPGRRVCMSCRSQQVSPVCFNRSSDIHSFPTARQAPVSLHAPHVPAIGQLSEGRLVAAPHTDVAPEVVVSEA